MYKVADCSNKMKGSLIAQLRQAAMTNLAAVNVMATRARETSNEELAGIRCELEKLRMENQRLRREVEQLRECSQAATPSSLVSNPSGKVSLGAKRRKTYISSDTDSESEKRTESPPPQQQAREERFHQPALPLLKQYATALKERRNNGHKEMEIDPPSTSKPAHIIMGPKVGGRARPIPVEIPGMNEEEMQRYHILLEEMKSLQVTAAERAQGNAIPSRSMARPIPAKRSLVTGEEVKTSLPQRTQKAEAAPTGRHDHISTLIIEEEARTSTPHRGDGATAGRLLPPVIAKATQEGESKKKKNKKKKKGKAPPETRGPNLSTPGRRESQAGQEIAKPPRTREEPVVPGRRTGQPLNNKGTQEATRTTQKPQTIVEKGWTVVGKKKKEGGGSKEETGGRVNKLPPTSKTNTASQPSPPPPSSKKKKRKRVPRTAAVIITCSAGDYKENLQHAVRSIDLTELEINGMTARRALTGAQIYEIKGPDNNKKADALANRLREVMADKEGVHITRPTMMAEIRVRDLNDSVEPHQVADAIARAGNCSPDDIRTGVVQFTGRGMGTLWVRCPLAVANKMVAAKKIRLGWINARIEALEQRPLQCYRCLEKRHVQAQCSSGTSRADCCYRCGKTGHIARSCRAPVECPICASLGRPKGHKAGSRTCTAPKRRAKGNNTQPNSSSTPRTRPELQAQGV